MSDLELAIKLKIKESEDLISSSNSLVGICGAKRLKAKIYAEHQFLSRLLKKPEAIKEEHLRGTNLSHLAAILSCIIASENVVEIFKPVTWINNRQQACQLNVDVVADFGSTWIKIVARNPQALLHSSLGASSYGKRTLTDQMKDLLQCAKFHPYLYKPPKLKVYFAAGVTPYLVTALQKLNIDSIGTLVEADDDEICDLLGSDNESASSANSTNPNNSDDEESGELILTESNNQTQTASNKTRCLLQEEDLLLQFNSVLNLASTKNKILLSLAEIPVDATLNLDVSTLICFVSNLTNGQSQFRFQDKILTEQAERERASPIKPILNELFRGRNLVCCQMAYDDFQEILSVVGGPSERRRAADFLKEVQVLANKPSAQAMTLNISSRIKDRSRIVFGTGDAIEAITVTANQGFLRAAEAQGINFVSFLHESRALTEMKEDTALTI